jgi:hypothetical protein
MLLSYPVLIIKILSHCLHIMCNNLKKNLAALLSVQILSFSSTTLIMLIWALHYVPTLFQIPGIYIFEGHGQMNTDSSQVRIWKQAVLQYMKDFISVFTRENSQPAEIRSGFETRTPYYKYSALPTATSIYSEKEKH